MSDEPLYCTHCGTEDFACDCDLSGPDGEICEFCGVKYAGCECPEGPTCQDLVKGV